MTTYDLVWLLRPDQPFLIPMNQVVCPLEFFQHFTRLSRATKVHLPSVHVGSGIVSKWNQGFPRKLMECEMEVLLLRKLPR
jgi:hypothetical protein